MRRNTMVGRSMSGASRSSMLHRRKEIMRMTESKSYGGQSGVSSNSSDFELDIPQRKYLTPFKHANKLGSFFELNYINDWKNYLVNERREFYYRLRSKHERSAKINQFKLIKTIGCGAYARVFLAKKKDTKHYYALKLYEKKLLVELNMVNHVANERKAMDAIRFPFIVHADLFFQDYAYVYFALPLCLGGELTHFIKTYSPLSEGYAKFVTAQVILALEYLHNLDIVYRDLKPENVVIDHDGFIKLTDFTTCKFLYGATRTYSLCGTPEYFAPEMLTTCGHGKPVDFWQLGVFIYEIVSGFTPYYTHDLLLIYQNILENRYRTLCHITMSLNHLISKLLRTVPESRLGARENGIEDIKNHAWFKNIIWIAIVNKNCKPPFIPKVKRVKDTKCFFKFEEIPLKVEHKPRWCREFSHFY